MPKIKNYTIKKMIKITPDQNANWNPKRIRSLLDQKLIDNPMDTNIQLMNNIPGPEILSLLKGLHQLMLEKFDSKSGVTLIPSEIVLIQKIEELIK